MSFMSAFYFGVVRYVFFFFLNMFSMLLEPTIHNKVYMETDG